MFLEAGKEVSPVHNKYKYTVQGVECLYKINGCIKSMYVMEPF